jgi:asparagine synthetase B (glutamine-hydrolysing)
VSGLCLDSQQVPHNKNDQVGLGATRLRNFQPRPLQPSTTINRPAELWGAHCNCCLLWASQNHAITASDNEMCGIYASISTGGFRPPSNDLSSLLCNRGPDHLGETQTEVLDDGKTYSLSFTSTVLALRGGNVQVQPFVDDETGSVLCWNGEAWKIESEHISGNDGQKLFDALIQASIQKTPEIAILDVLRSVSGPFAFVFLDKIHGQVYFGRDRLGRRSLLYNTESIPKCVEFASTSRPGDNCWKEVEADAIYQVSFRAQSALQDPSDHLLATSLYSLQRQTWVSSDAKSAVSTSPELEPSASSSLQDGFHNANWGQLPATATFNRSVPNNNDVLTFQSASVKLLKEHLRESLKFRILNVPVPPRLHERSAKVCMAILFSGGLDCTVLARMAHDLLPSDQQIDLLNVAFENPRVVQAAKAPPMKSKKRNKNSQSPSNVAEIEEDKAVAVLTQLTTILSPYESCPDRETGRKSFQELQKVCPGRVWRFVAVRCLFVHSCIGLQKSR